MKRWILTVLFGPRCDAGTAGGTPCCNPGTYQTLPVPPGWSRGFRWCIEHRPEAAKAIGLERASKEGAK